MVGLRLHESPPLPQSSVRGPPAFGRDLRLAMRRHRLKRVDRGRAGLHWNARTIARFRRLLLGWYRRHRRALPWRSDPSPYRVWVSEVMLQQTQVRAVIPCFERFTGRFPDLAALAAAPLDDVLEAWAGLGYYSRARNLHRAANAVMARHAGVVPEKLEDLLDLPGIGRYTAGAIRSIAFNLPEPAVDGNVKRVVARLRGVEGAVPDRFFREQATAWTDPRHPSDFNQAVMELGALVCVPATPRCDQCPVTTLCDARREGIQNSIPRPGRAASSERVRLAVLLLVSAGRVLIVRQPLPFVPGVWGLPSVALDEGEDPERAASRYAEATLGAAIRLAAAGTVRHAITYRSIKAYLFRGNHPGISDTTDRRSVPPAETRSLFTSSLYRKALECASHRQSRPPPPVRPGPGES